MPSCLKLIAEPLPTSEVRKNGKLKWLRPDAKSQLSFDYDSNGNPSAITAVVLSTQHDGEVSQDDLKEGVMEEILKPVLPTTLNFKLLTSLLSFNEISLYLKPNNSE